MVTMAGTAGIKMGGQNNINSGMGMDQGMQQNMQSGMMPVQKPPMDPQKKKKLILGISLGVGGVVLAIVGIVVAVIVLSPNYGESYKIAKELRPKVLQFGSNYDCADVVEDVGNTYVDIADYEENIENCLVAAESVPELVTQLGQTSGVKRDKEVKTQFERFQEALNAVLPDESELETRLHLYSAWHKFIVAKSETSWAKTSDAEFQSVAKNLTESGNEVLAKYGGGWLERTLAAAKAYRAWDNASYSAKNYSELRQAATDATSEQSTWVSENVPDIAELGGLEFKNNNKTVVEFDKLYDMIVELYEQNYDGSGECSEFLGDVYCE